MYAKRCQPTADYNFFFCCKMLKKEFQRTSVLVSTSPWPPSIYVLIPFSMFLCPKAYFVRGKCQRGAFCDMCHEVHNHIPLSKAQRLQIGKLLDWELLTVIHASDRTAPMGQCNVETNLCWTSQIRGRLAHFTHFLLSIFEGIAREQPACGMAMCVR